MDSLERKMLTGFGELVSKTKPTLKERLYLVAVVAASILTFSLLFVHAPASSVRVQKSILDALAEAGKAVQREKAREAQEAQRKLQRLTKYRQQDHDRE